MKYHHLYLILIIAFLSSPLLEQINLISSGGYYSIIVFAVIAVLLSIDLIRAYKPTKQ